MRERQAQDSTVVHLPDTPVPKLYSAAEVAANLGRSVKTIIRWFDPRIGRPGVFDFGYVPSDLHRRSRYTQLRITTQAVQDFLDDQKV